MKLFKSPLFLGALSGLGIGISVVTLNEWLVWFALVPLILGVHEKSFKDIAKASLLSGFISGVVILAWIPQALNIYAGTSEIAGYTGVVILALFGAFWIMCIFLIYNILRIKDCWHKYYMTINLLLFSSSFFLVEFIRIHVFPGIVWNKLFLASALAGNHYMIQLASITGALGIGIFVAMVNYLIAHSIILKKRKFLIFAAGILIGNLLYGMAAFHLEKTRSDNARIAGIVCENVEAETRWMEDGDAIINTMLKLVEESTDYHPEILVWSETALPWTYMVDDDILIAISGILKRNNRSTQSIIGYLTEADHESNLVYNSAYLIDADGKAVDRVDKRKLLTFFEEPLIRDDRRTAIPMLTQSIYNNVKRGERRPILNTNAGKVWVMVCNESLLPFYFGYPEVLPDYLVNMSNDAWLEDTQNIKHHFYLARYRAIEYRKDMIINSNRGLSGFVRSNGEVVTFSQSDSPELLIGTICPNSIRTPYSRLPMAMPIFIFLIFCIIIFYNFILKFTFNLTKPT